jgi:hypothetical protein
MLKYILSVLAVAMLVPAASAQERHSPGIHRHGHGTLDLAIEGGKVFIELRVPGADIAGFEHPAQTAQERAAIERATADLRDPLVLFAPPASAGCRVAAARVALAGEGGRAHAMHAEFHADYTLSCTRPDALDRINLLNYFEKFPRARELDVNAITDRGQTAHEVERARPVIDLKRTP